MKKERRDVLKSREAVKRAFIELCINQDTSKITVNQILASANISRGTFYAHFQDIYDVRKQVEDDLLAICKEAMQEADIHEIVRNPYSQIKKAVIFFQEYADTIKHLSHGTHSSFIAQYKKILLQGIQESEHTLADNATVSLLDACIIGAVVDGCLEMITQEGSPLQDAETATQIISKFVSQGMQGFLPADSEE